MVSIPTVSGDISWVRIEGLLGSGSFRVGSQCAHPQVELARALIRKQRLDVLRMFEGIT